MTIFSRKFFCKTIILSFMFSSSIVNAFEYPEASIGAKIKHFPELVVSAITVTPIAICPFLNIFAATGTSSSGSSLYGYIRDKNIAIQKEFVANNPQKAQDYLDLYKYDWKLNFDNEEFLLTPENFELKYSLLKRMNEVFSKTDYKVSNRDSGLIGMLDCVNSENYDFFLTLLSEIENGRFFMQNLHKLYYRDTSCYKENLELIKSGLKDGTYLEYVNLHKFPEEKFGYKYVYNSTSFADNYSTYLLLKENVFTEEQIASIINLAPVELVDKRHTAFNMASGFKMLEYREKYKVASKVLKKSKLTPEQKYEKLYKKLAKTKMEKFTHLPIVKQTIETGDAVISFPIAVLFVPHSIYFDMVGEVYRNTYNVWEKDVAYKELKKKDIKAFRNKTQLNK